MGIEIGNPSANSNGQLIASVQPFDGKAGVKSSVTGGSSCSSCCAAAEAGCLPNFQGLPLSPSCVKKTAAVAQDTDAREPLKTTTAMETDLCAVALPEALPEADTAKPRWADLEDSENEAAPETGKRKTTSRRRPKSDEASTSASSTRSDLDTLPSEKEHVVRPAKDPSPRRERERVPKEKDDGCGRGGRQSKKAQGPIQAEGYGWHQAEPRAARQWTERKAWQERQEWQPAAKGYQQWPQEKRSRGKAQQAASKQQCQFIVGIEEDYEFRVVRRLLGSHGANMKVIAEKTGAKMRLRGKGSRFLEGPEQQESEDPLMLCVSAQDPASYEEATRLISDLLEDIYSERRSFCNCNGRPVPNLCVKMHEGARKGAR